VYYFFLDRFWHFRSLAWPHLVHNLVHKTSTQEFLVGLSLVLPQWFLISTRNSTHVARLFWSHFLVVYGNFIVQELVHERNGHNCGLLQVSLQKVYTNNSQPVAWKMIAPSISQSCKILDLTFTHRVILIKKENKVSRYQ
jgi:hypothetical protein